MHLTKALFFRNVVCLAVLLSASMGAQNITVTVRVRFAQPKRQNSSPKASGPQAVVWLKPLDVPEGSPGLSASPGVYKIVQKDKMFVPHLLVAAVGSQVQFPNLDPFFHNVFSLFNGKRFDLGLYETGSQHSVLFNREGVSYIFCNIHPQMSAVVLALTTPYYAIATGSGTVTLQNVPPGNYRMHVWTEVASDQELRDLTRPVAIGAGKESQIAAIVIPVSDRPTADHKNKFGQDYQLNARPAY